LNNAKSWILEVQENKESGEFYIELSDEMLEASGFKIGDELHWIDNHDGSFTLMKEPLTTFINNGIINNE